MADQEKPAKELINARYSVRVQGIPADEATDSMALIKELFAKWGDVDVNVNISTPRKPHTLEDIRRAQR